MGTRNAVHSSFISYSFKFIIFGSRLFGHYQSGHLPTCHCRNASSFGQDLPALFLPQSTVDLSLLYIMTIMLYNKLKSYLSVDFQTLPASRSRLHSEQ